MGALEIEVDRNYDAFVDQLAALLPERFGEYALIRNLEMIGFFSNVSAALAAGRASFPDGIYSVQEITDRPADLGFFSHAVDSRIA